MDCSLPDSSVHVIFQARVLEWVAISFSRVQSINCYVNNGCDTCSLVNNLPEYIRISKVVLVAKNLPANAGDIRASGSMPGSGKFPGGGHGNLLQYSCLENPHGQRSLAGYSSRGHKELDTTEVTKDIHRVY